MISASDVVHLCFSEDLTVAGIAYACRSLPRMHRRANRAPYDRLRRVIAGVAVELAFRRFLTEQGITFGVKTNTPFTQPDRYDVALAGHRCEIRSFLISRPNQVAALSSEPGLALKASAIIPLDELAAAGQSDDNLYLFALSAGLITSSRKAVHEPSAAEQPAYLIHCMPTAWSQPSTWIPLGPLALKMDSDRPLQIEIGGQDADREFLAGSMELQPRRRVESAGGFHSVTFLHAMASPGGRIGIHSPGRGQTHLVSTNDWGNIWIAGRDIYLVGWITRAEFRRRARLLPEGSRVFQLSRTRTKNLAVPMTGLRPLSELFELVRGWQRGRR